MLQEWENSYMLNGPQPQSKTHNKKKNATITTKYLYTQIIKDLIAISVDNKGATEQQTTKHK